MWVMQGQKKKGQDKEKKREIKWKRQKAENNNAEKQRLASLGGNSLSSLIYKHMHKKICFSYQCENIAFQHQYMIWF